MKRTLIFLLICSLSSCVTTYKWPYVQESSIIDYSHYAKKGFFITQANSVNFEYTPIGSISAKVEGGYEVLNIDAIKVSGDDIYSRKPETKIKVQYGKYIKATPDAAIDELYNQAVENKANGIIGLKIEPITNYSQQYGNVVTGYFVTGMAIKKQKKCISN